MSRKKPSLAQRTVLGEYYGHACVVTGMASFEWHHLDDDDSNTVIENLLPLEHGLNLHLRDVAKRAEGRVPVQLRASLDPTQLVARAQTLFGGWQLGPAYGCARLASFVASQYLFRPIDERIHFACDAIFYARNRLQHDFIRDTLERDVLPALTCGALISDATRTKLLREIAGIYAEHGRTVEALELYADFDPRKCLLDGRHQAAIMRRVATTEAAQNGLTDRVVRILDEALVLSAGDQNLQVSTANSRGWLQNAGGYHKKALDTLTPLATAYQRAVFKPDRGIVPTSANIWNVAELLQNFAVAIAGAKPSQYKRRAGTALFQAHKLYELSGAKRYELFDGFSSVSAGFLENSVPLILTNDARERPRLPVSLWTQMRRVIQILWA